MNGNDMTQAMRDEALKNRQRYAGEAGELYAQCRDEGGQRVSKHFGAKLTTPIESDDAKRLVVFGVGSGTREVLFRCRVDDVGRVKGRPASDVVIEGVWLRQPKFFKQGSSLEVGAAISFVRSHFWGACSDKFNEIPK